MTTLLFKFLASSALMLGLYWLMLRNKASYKINRIFLIAMPIACLLMSVIRLEVYSADNQITPENLMPEIKIEKKIALNNTVKESSINTQETQIEIAAEESSTEETKAETNWAMFFGISIASVSAVLVIIALFYILKIARIKSMMKSEPTDEGYHMVKSLQIKTPFSYQKTIFLPADLDEDSEKLITRHEKAHIAHHHYVDVIVSEFITRILWFNPFIWIARNELRNVHEFEADHEVISHGTNIKKYQTTLLEMVMNETTPVVSGFNHSFIRRRFIEMKKSTAGTLGYVGKAISITAVAAMFCGFTFTSCKANAPEPTGNITFQPGWFVIKGTVDPVIADSAYNVYLGDKYQHLSKDPDTSVVVNNKQWEYKVYLDAPRAGQIAAIFPGGSVCEATIGFIAIPGDTVCINVHNGFYDTEGSTRTHYINANNAIKSMREATNGETPRLPKIDCAKHWTKVGQKKVIDRQTYNTTSALQVTEVFFTDTATVVKIMTNSGSNNVHFGNDLCLKDTDGKTYKFKHATISDINDNWGIEPRVYGDLIFFEPMPMSTENFAIVRDRDSQVFWSKVFDKSNEPEQPENFVLTVSGDELKDWDGRLSNAENGSEDIIEFEPGKDGQAVIRKVLEETGNYNYELSLRNNKAGKVLWIIVNINDTISVNFHDGEFDMDGNSEKIKEINKVKEYYKKAIKEKGEDKAEEIAKDYFKSCIEPETNHEAFSAAFDYFINYERAIKMEKQEDYRTFMEEIDPNFKIHCKN